MTVKKSLFAICAALLGTLTLGACNKEGENSSNTESIPQSSQQIGEVTWVADPLEFVVGDVPSDYDWLEGVTATTSNGDTLTVSVDQDTVKQIVESTSVRLFALPYTATDAGGNVVSTYNRRVNIIQGYKVPNGDFSQGTVRWSTAFNSGSAGNVSIATEGDNSMLKYNITDAGTEAWMVQTEYDGAQLKAGQTYKYSVDAKAEAGSEGKSLSLGLEDLDNGYAVLLPAYVEYSLTTDMTTYSVYYTPDKDYNNVKVALYMGRGLDADDRATSDAPLVCYVDNVRIEKVEDAGVTFTGNSATASDRIRISSPGEIEKHKADLKASIGDEDVTDKLEWSGVIPEAFDSTIKTTNIGLMVTYTAEDGAVSAAYLGFDWTNPLLDRNEDHEPYNASFDQGFVSWTQDTGSYAEGSYEFIDNKDGTISIHVTPTSSADDWHLQLWQASSNLKAGHKYRIKLVAKCEANDPSQVLVRTEFDGDQHKTDLYFTSDFVTYYSNVLDVTADKNGVRTGILLAENTQEFTLTLDEFNVIDVTEDDPVQTE